MADLDTEMDPELRKQVFETMANLLTRILRRDSPITEESRLMDELGLSSSLSLELLLEMEDELEIQIDVEQLDQDNMVTAGDLADFIVTHSMPQ